MQGSQFQNCVVGCNTFVGTGCSLTDCLLMGNDNYTNAATIQRALQKDIIIGIGAPLVLSKGKHCLSLVQHGCMLMGDDTSRQSSPNQAIPHAQQAQHWQWCIPCAGEPALLCSAAQVWPLGRRWVLLSCDLESIQTHSECFLTCQKPLRTPAFRALRHFSAAAATKVPSASADVSACMPQGRT